MNLDEKNDDVKGSDDDPVVLGDLRHVHAEFIGQARTLLSKVDSLPSIEQWTGTSVSFVNLHSTNRLCANQLFLFSRLFRHVAVVMPLVMDKKTVWRKNMSKALPRTHIFLRFCS